MARIRSIHPGLFTDPEFAELDESAQVFFLGLLCEADDNGVFEWKPTMLRIRYRPTKDGPVDALLSELEAANKIASYEIGGRKYGAIRKFTQWQKPKSPKSWHPIPEHFRNYVGSGGSISEIPTDEVTTLPRKGEITPQREEGGGRREEEVTEPNGSGAPRASPDFAAVLFGACRKWLQDATGKDGQTCRRLLGKWRKALPDGDLVELLKNAQDRGHIEDPVSWVEAAIQARRGPPKRQHSADFN